MNNLTHIASTLKTIAQKQKVSARQLAEKLGKSQPTIYNALNGKAADIRVYIGIAQELGVNLIVDNGSSTVPQKETEITQTTEESEDSSSSGFCFQKKDE